tara:strand:- start:388 stop:573 length:186 start_codon:yes stop_codon:yes gene_type:complete
MSDNKYIVIASELVIYKITVDAKNEEEAEQKAYDIEDLEKHITEYNGFQIDSVDVVLPIQG